MREAHVMNWEGKWSGGAWWHCPDSPFSASLSWPQQTSGQYNNHYNDLATPPVTCICTDYKQTLVDCFVCFSLHFIAYFPLFSLQSDCYDYVCYLFVNSVCLFFTKLCPKLWIDSDDILYGVRLGPRNKEFRFWSLSRAQARSKNFKKNKFFLNLINCISCSLDIQE